MTRASSFLCWLSLLVLAVACSSQNQHVRTNVLANSDGPSEAPGYGFPARSGQLVLSESPGPYRLLFGFAPRDFRRLTHSGVLMVEDGEVYVYDYSGEFKSAFARTPADGINGGLRRTRFWEYVGSLLYVEVVEPPPTASGTAPDRQAMVRRLAEIRANPVDFDPYWNYQDRSAYFCTEFVAEVLAAGGAVVPDLVPLTNNPSLRKFLRWFGVGTDQALPAGLFAGGTRVAAFGTFRSNLQVDAYFAAKAEIHRRFVPDYKVGHIFYLENKDVKVHPHIEAFLAEATHLFDGTPSERLDEIRITLAVQELAVRRFGPTGLGIPASTPL